MNGILMLLFKMWIWRKNRSAEKAFGQQLEQEQETVRINWAEEFGPDIAHGRHHLRRR